MRRVKHASTAGQPRGQIIASLSISDRPADVEDRAIPGHWEGDLITGSQNTHMATLVERQSRFTLLVKVQGKDTTSMVTALSTQIRQLPSALRRSLTWDRRMELAQHKRRCFRRLRLYWKQLLQAPLEPTAGFLSSERRTHHTSTPDSRAHSTNRKNVLTVLVRLGVLDVNAPSHYCGSSLNLVRPSWMIRPRDQCAG
jgi:hypothetical protein